MNKNKILIYAFAVAVAIILPRMLQSKQAHDAKTATSKTLPATATPLSAATASAASLPQAPEHLITLTTDRFVATVSSLNAGLKSFALEDKQFHADGGRPIDLVTTDKPVYYPLALNIAGVMPPSQGFELQQLSPTAVRVSGQTDGLAIERKLEAGSGPYQIWITTTIANLGTTPRKLALSDTTYHYVAHKDESGGIPFLPARSSAISSALCHHASDFERLDRKKLEEPKRWAGPVRFTGVENVYFLKAIVAAEDSGAPACSLEASERGIGQDGKPLGTLFAARLEQAPMSLAPGERHTQRSLAYFGPKTPEELARVGHSLREAINSGFFTSVSDVLTWLLLSIHGFVGNWGIAIVLLTFFVKLVLYPLTHKQMESMAKMKDLKPEMDKLNELYADDREKKGAAVMELYRKKGVNPMAGCFPVVLQLPIWFSLYASLSSNIHLFHAPFALWWRDLSSPDPYFVLPLSLGVLMFIQQKIAPPTGTDPLQAKMMLYMMPTMITSFMLFLPAGLCLYMLTNSALSIVQQRVIEARLKQARVSATASSSSSQVAELEREAREGNDNDPASAASKSKLDQRRLRRARK